MLLALRVENKLLRNRALVLKRAKNNKTKRSRKMSDSSKTCNFNLKILELKNKDECCKGI